jgi:predicted TIM-barrel fold metal-dependent hydrolase
MMAKNTFLLDPKLYGLPSREELASFRIWDSHYHGFYATGTPIKQHDAMLHYVERMGVERIISVDIGGTLAEPITPMAHDAKQLEILQKFQSRVLGIIPIDPGYPQESIEKMNRWIKDGPCIGIKYVGGNKLGVTCEAPQNDLIIQHAKKLQAVIYIHTWIKVGGEPRRPGGANLAGESTPWQVVELAKRFPDVQMICGHAGGDWELAVRTVRPFENILFEFSGADPHSGSVDLAVKELGADRIVWGGHGPSRSFSTEFSKVLDGDLTHKERVKIFGENYRRLCKPIFDQKKWKLIV